MTTDSLLECEDAGHIRVSVLSVCYVGVWVWYVVWYVSMSMCEILHVYMCFALYAFCVFQFVVIHLHLMSPFH